MTLREKDEEDLENTIHALHLTVLFCGCAAITMYYALWYFKKRHFEKTVENLPPPIDWEDFASRFIAKNLVKQLNFRPDFFVVDVYLQLTKGEIEKKLKEDRRISIIPLAEYALKPDLRFYFGGSEEELKNDVENALLDAGLTGDIELHVDKFPDKIELMYMITTTIFFAFFVFAILKKGKTRRLFRRQP
uniref:DUF4359 domain-containing protein n=1 Tax=Syphacia muris TaxID=451379 RepID=A0A0N5AUX8_9BILA